MCWILPAKRCSDFKWNPNENVRCPFGYWKTADSFVGNRYLGEKIFVCHVKSVYHNHREARNVSTYPITFYGMLKKKRRTKKQPEPAPEPIAKTIKKRRRRRRKPVAEPVPVTAEPKTLMQLIFEAQRTELDRLNEALRTRVFEG